MSKGNTWANDLIKAIYQNDTTALDAVLALSEFYVALHTADPGASGSQNTNEVSYTGYTRVAVTRDSSGWNISGRVVSPVDPITFPAVAGAAGNIATHVSIGTAISGAGKIIEKGAITPNISCDLGSEPSLKNTSIITEAC